MANKSFLQNFDLQTKNVFSPGALVLAHQTGNIDASFVLHYLLSDFIKEFGQSSRVLLVLTSDSVNHWAAISSKLGWNLNTYQAKGQLMLVDLGENVFKTITGLGNEDVTGSDISLVSGSIDLDNLYRRCEQRIRTCSNVSQDGTERTKLFVVIDDLTSLMVNSAASDLKLQERRIFEFLQRLLNLGDTVKDQDLCDLCFATSVDIIGGSSSFVADRILSSAVFEVAPLQTGYSQLFSGYLTVKRRATADSSLEPSVKSYHYKLDDREVKIFPLDANVF